jgi:hypothetical protein
MPGVKLQRLVLPKSQRLGLRRQLRARDRSLGVSDTQAVRSLFAGLVGNVLEAFLQMRRTPDRMMRIGGQKVDPVPFQKLV